MEGVESHRSRVLILWFGWMCEGEDGEWSTRDLLDDSANCLGLLERVGELCVLLNYTVK